MKQATITIVQIDDFKSLLCEAEMCADWMCDAPKGSDQKQRGEDLMRSIRKNKANLKDIIHKHAEILANPFKNS